MKVQDLGRRLETLSILLGRTQPEMLEKLAAVAGLLKDSPATNINQFTKALSAATPLATEEPSGVTGGDVAATLSTLLAIAQQLEAKKAVIDDFTALRDALSAAHLQHVGVASISAGLKAPRKPIRVASTKKDAAVRDKVVSEYLKNLEATLGQAAFDQHFGRLMADRRIRGIEAAAIASKFVSETSKSAKKSESLERIKSRHDNLTDSQRKDKVLTMPSQGR